MFAGEQELSTPNGCRIEPVFGYGIMKLTNFMIKSSLKDVSESPENLKLMVFMIIEKPQYTL